jgi:uncharacterized membrane protein
MKKYIRAVNRRLNMPKNLRKRVLNDLESSVNSRLEAGQTLDEILLEFGSPKEAAAELNRQMQEYTYKKSPWRWGCLVLMIVSFLSFCFQGTLGLLSSVFNFHTSHSVGLIGGADGPTAVFITAPEGYYTQQATIAAVLLIMSILGFWALSHIKRK